MNTFPFRKIENKGQKDKYYVRNSHPAIVSRDVFEKAQTLLKRRGPEREITRGEYPLSRMMRCGSCGATFKRRVGKSGIVYWTCRKHDAGKELCAMPRIPEAAVFEAFLRMANKLRAHKGAVLHPALSQLTGLWEACKKGNTRLAEIRAELTELAGQSHLLTTLRTKGVLDEEVFRGKTNEINTRSAELRRRQRFLLDGDGQKERIEKLEALLELLEERPGAPQKCGEDFFQRMVKQIVIDAGDKIRFRLHAGIELEEYLRG